MRESYTSRSSGARRSRSHSPGRRRGTGRPHSRTRSRSPGSRSRGVASRLASKKFSPPRMRSDDLPKPSLSSRLRPSSRDRDRDRKRRDRRPSSTSPSPPRSRARRDSPRGQTRGRGDETFRITVSTAATVSNPKSEISERARKAFLEMRQRDLTSSETPRHSAMGSKTRDDRGSIFRGPEFGSIDSKEQRKIQIDIRRSIPSHRVSNSPIRRDIRDTFSVVVARGRNEGSKPIFARDEINDWLPRVEEQRSINVVAKDGDRSRHRSSSPRRRQRSRSPVGNDLRSRLGDRERDRDHGQSRNNGDSVKDRLGERRGRGHSVDDPDRVLDREELEMQRPVVKPWEINPEFVPRGRGYFEHDNHESFEPFNFRGRGFRGRGMGRGRGSYRQRWGGYDNNRRGDNYRRGGDFGRFGRGRGGRRGRDPSPEWKHDKFDDINKDEDMDV